MRNSFFIFVAILFIPLLIEAQTLRGTITDERNQPLEFANVEVYALPDTLLVTGTITDSLGVFTIARQLSGKLQLPVDTQRKQKGRDNKGLYRFLRKHRCSNICSRESEGKPSLYPCTYQRAYHKRL